MRTDRGWRRFYATGWFLSAVIAACGFNAWQQRMEAIEGQLAEEERTREAIIQRVAAEERLRIARDLHDSLTHNISVIKVQSGVAAHLARKRGEEVPPALQAIQEAAGEAARELREVLHVLRQDMDQGNGSRRLADLPQLLDRARAAGLEAELAVTGCVRQVPDEVDSAAYRIVQEALTNVSRHAGQSAAARVRVGYGPDLITVQVDDDGAGRKVPPSGAGLGLIGMRERATALGGHLVAQGRPGRGFTVRAELPAVPASAGKS